ncbi:unnamed protein product [Mytilus coruscus]|uniref:Endonuclease/exonuclease/phosphatase domain-containing protein n=1 Tax=Mytilus coruscus TaxID=42192 RepID=A0A6J8DMY8_MYTCO|nr:unnamed protein product [Mytilus coruscus]
MLEEQNRDYEKRSHYLRENSIVTMLPVRTKCTSIMKKHIYINNRLHQFEATIKSQLDILKIEMQHKFNIHELNIRHHLESLISEKGQTADNSATTSIQKNGACEVDKGNDPTDNSADVTNIDYTEVLVKNRGFGSFAMFWRKNIDRVVRFTSDGNDRIVVLTFKISNNPSCLIDVFMLSHNKHGDELFIDILPQIEEIIEKNHHSGYRVILYGDMNASLFRDDISRDKRFKCFVENNYLCLTDNYPKAPTFYHHN